MGLGQPGIPAPWALQPCPSKTWCGPAALLSIMKQSTSLLSRLYKDPRQRAPACYGLMGAFQQEGIGVSEPGLLHRSGGHRAQAVT